MTTSDRCPTCGQRKKRSLGQNSLGHNWYQLMSEFSNDQTAIEWKCYCKLHHGVPILRSEDDEFKKMYDTAIKGLTYEQKLQCMKILPVTSRMNTDQHRRYLDDVSKDFADRGLYLVTE